MKYFVSGKGKAHMVKVAAVCIAVMAGLYIENLWSINRMHISCFVLGDWGGSSLSSIKDAEEEEFWSISRTAILLRHDADSLCGEEDRQKHWENISYMATQHGWAEAQYLLSLKLGYGGFSLPPFNHENFANFSEELILQVPQGFGDGREMEPEKSFELLKLSAEQGFPIAEGRLSHAYLVGQWAGVPVEVDMEESERLMERYSRHSGYNSHFLSYGSFFLGERYLSAKHGVPLDYRKGLAYLEEAAADGDFIAAQVELARLYACGEHTEVDIVAARKWQEQAKQSSIEQYSYGDTFGGWKDYMERKNGLTNDCIERISAASQ